MNMGCCGNGDKTDAVEMSSHSKDDDEKPVGEYGKKNLYFFYHKNFFMFLYVFIYILYILIYLCFLLYKCVLCVCV